MVIGIVQYQGRGESTLGPTAIQYTPYTIVPIDIHHRGNGQMHFWSRLSIPPNPIINTCGNKILIVFFHA